jgi:hypothetical protein
MKPGGLNFTGGEGGGEDLSKHNIALGYILWKGECYGLKRKNVDWETARLAHMKLFALAE